MYFWSVSFVYQLFGQILIFLVDQISFWYTKIFFGRPKKWEIDRTIGIPKRLTKSTWTPLLKAVSLIMLFLALALSRFRMLTMVLILGINYRPGNYCITSFYCIISRFFDNLSFLHIGTFVKKALHLSE